MIYISRWVEALSTVVDMAFGFTSMWAVVYPSTNENVQRRNVYISIFGILLAPFLCIVDFLFQW
ncbi:hypothetical protein BDR26DRAFT_872788 [Obelidium mucronatum]|nr:hypothetical protein BDR26DRAFT_872788 [Obelidium mucronatum]